MAQRFVWNTLESNQPALVIPFYTALFGWEAHNAETMPGYTLFLQGKRPHAGMTASTGESIWVPYLAVDDVDAAVVKVVELGGTVTVPPTDIPGTGRFAGIVDPQGAALRLFSASGSEQPPVTGHGAFHWTELSAVDVDSALAFYQALGGFEAQKMDMPEGAYWVLMAGGTPRAGIKASRCPKGSTRWLPWIAVDDVDVTTRLATEVGGTVVREPWDVPGVGRLAMAVDPAGGLIAWMTPVQH